MRRIILAVIFVGAATAASAQGLWGHNHTGGQSGTGSNPSSHYVAPHYNSNGTFTQGHQQTNPNNTQRDNFGATGNYNPYTGAYGTRAPQH